MKLYERERGSLRFTLPWGGRHALLVVLASAFEAFGGVPEELLLSSGVHYVELNIMHAA